MHKIFPTLFPMCYSINVGNKSWEKDMELSLDNEEQIETVCLLSNRKPDTERAEREKLE